MTSDQGHHALDRLSPTVAIATLFSLDTGIQAEIDPAVCEACTQGAADPGCTWPEATDESTMGLAF